MDMDFLILLTKVIFKKELISIYKYEKNSFYG